MLIFARKDCFSSLHLLMRSRLQSTILFGFTINNMKQSKKLYNSFTVQLFSEQFNMENGCNFITALQTGLSLNKNAKHFIRFETFYPKPIVEFFGLANTLCTKNRYNVNYNSRPTHDPIM